MGSVEINPHIYGQLIYDKEARLYSVEQTISISGVQNWTATVKRMKLEHSPTPST